MKRSNKKPPRPADQRRRAVRTARLLLDLRLAEAEKAAAEARLALLDDTPTDQPESR